MTETTTTATNKAKTTKHAASSSGLSDYGMSKFEMPKFGLPNTEMPEAFREMAEKGVAHVRDTNAKARVACEQAADVLENTYAAFAKGAEDYNLKLIGIARTNTRAAFDYAHELLAVKSPSEFIELSTARMRNQFDIVSAQNSELCALAQKVVTDVAEPITTGMSVSPQRSA
jgi:phasin